MARITVEDCLDNVDNRFELVIVASKRARDLSMHGADSELEWENDKPTVLALREIAAGLIDKSVLTTKPRRERELDMSAELPLEVNATEQEDRTQP